MSCQISRKKNHFSRTDLLQFDYCWKEKEKRHVEQRNSRIDHQLVQSYLLFLYLQCVINIFAWENDNKMIVIRLLGSNNIDILSPKYFLFHQKISLTSGSELVWKPWWHIQCLIYRFVVVTIRNDDAGTLHFLFVSNSDNWVDTYRWWIVFKIKHEGLCLSRLTKYNYIWTIMDIKRIWMIDQNRKSIFLAWFKNVQRHFFSVVNRHAMSTILSFELMDCK